MPIKTINDKKEDDKVIIKKIARCREKLENLFGFKFEYFYSFEKFTRLMYRPTDASSLGVCRMLFGIMMLLDIPEERAGGQLDLRYGDPRQCRFPLLPFLQALPLAYMGLLYGIMYLGAIGLALGSHMRLSCAMFGIPYWYIFLLDKSFWNNHSYLFGLITILLVGTSATNYCSISRKKDSSTVPYWNYFILKYQFFILYFVAGLKKLCTEWLSGHAMTNLSQHWVFSPFRMFLTPEHTDLLIVHWFGCFFDLTVAFCLIIENTRLPAMFFATMFHLMNSRLFSIGMFPWVCLVELPLFCKPDWPKQLLKKFKRDSGTEKTETDDLKDIKKHKTIKADINSDQSIQTPITWKQRLVVGLLLSYCGVQAFLPYSHFITKGYNNWTEGLYGYSWDMMVHAWDTILVTVKVTENDSNITHFLDPNAFTENDRWTKHGDMAYQYAQCVKTNLLKFADEYKNKPNYNGPQSSNISILIDVWSSLNGRFQQRMFDPSVDLLTVNWSPFQKVSWLLPLLNQFTDFRSQMADIQNHVHSWGNHSEVLFVADFPGLFLENYIPSELDNVTVTVLNGRVKYEDESGSFSKLLVVDQHFSITPGGFHKIYTLGNEPACYMYTYVNRTRIENNINEILDLKPFGSFNLMEEISARFENMLKFYEHVGNSLLHLVYGVPMPRRVKID